MPPMTRSSYSNWSPLSSIGPDRLKRWSTTMIMLILQRCVPYYQLLIVLTNTVAPAKREVSEAPIPIKLVVVAVLTPFHTGSYLINLSKMLFMFQASGPLEEINFWRSRTVDLSGISDQLNRPDVLKASSPHPTRADTTTAIISNRHQLTTSFDLTCRVFLPPTI